MPNSKCKIIFSSVILPKPQSQPNIWLPESWTARSYRL